jgi:hypothetical protein
MTQSQALAFLVVSAALSAALGLAVAQRPAPDAPRRRTHASLTEGLACTACHTTEGWSLAVGSGGQGFDHSTTGFPLTGQHQNTACAQCHVDGQRTVRACVSCHEDAEHQGRLGRECAQCHNAVSWQQTDAIALHRQTRLPLTGMHVLADCTGCHRRTGERQWTDVPSDCFGCHARDYFNLGTHSAAQRPRRRDPVPARLRAVSPAQQLEPGLRVALGGGRLERGAAAGGPRRLLPHQHRQPPRRALRVVPRQRVAAPAPALRRRLPRAPPLGHHRAAQPPGRLAGGQLPLVPPRGGRAMRRVGQLTRALRGALLVGACVLAGLSSSPAARAQLPEHPAGSVAVRVTAVAGEHAFIEPGASAGLYPGATVVFGDARFEVEQVARGSASVRIGSSLPAPLAIGAEGVLDGAPQGPRPAARCSPSHHAPRGPAARWPTEASGPRRAPRRRTSTPSTSRSAPRSAPTSASSWCSRAASWCRCPSAAPSAPTAAPCCALSCGRSPRTCRWCSTWTPRSSCTWAVAWTCAPAARRGPSCGCARCKPSTASVARSTRRWGACATRPR